MKSVTKNTLENEMIRKLARQAFPQRECTAINELTEGYFNAAYRIVLDNGQQLVLKVAPLPGARIMSYEKNIMYSELMAMRLAAAKTSMPVARVLYDDNSCTLCPSPYFFMEMLSGQSLHSRRQYISHRQYHGLQVEMGRLNRQLNNIANQRFGLPGQPAFQHTGWYSAFRQILLLALADARAENIDLGIPPERLLSLLEQDQAVFEQVKTARLVHWDLWDGNILITEDRITGIIDWERCLWADPLMEVGFRTYGKHQGFFDGYGITRLTPDEHRRALWYDVYLMMLMAQEYVYRQYDSPDLSLWAAGVLKDKYLELQG